MKVYRSILIVILLLLAVFSSCTGSGGSADIPGIRKEDAPVEWVEIGPHERIKHRSGNPRDSPNYLTDEAYLTEVGDKLAFAAEKDGKSFIVYDGKEFGPYEFVGNPIDIGDKLTYIVWKDSKWVIIYDGKEVGD